MAGRLDQRVALVTGGGGGLGRAIAKTFAVEGAAVGVLDRDGEAAEKVAIDIRAQNGRAVAITADVSVTDEVEAAVERIIAEFKTLDVLCNGAGVLFTGSAIDCTDEVWERCLTVNAKGTFLCSRAALRHMVRNSGGVIVNIASVAAIAGQREFAAYSASKGAVAALTRSMAVDFGPSGVRVNAICPGAIPTAMMADVLRVRGDGDVGTGAARTAVKYPLGRLGTSQEIAHAALFLAGEEASFMTGAIMTVDGGLTV